MAAVPSIGRASRVEPDAAPAAHATSDLYERYSHQVFGYCLRHLSSREEAEDAVQTTFMNAFRGLARGIVPECEQAWLFKIAHNVCLSRRRSSWRRGRVEAPNNLEVLQEIVPAKEKVADELIPLQDALENMPENQRRAILLREWQGLSYREVADELGLSQAAVETLIFRARRSLAAGLEEAPASGSLRKRLRHGADAGGVLAFVKTLFGGGGAAAVKAAAAVAVAGVAVATTAAEHARQQNHGRQPAVVPPAAFDNATAPTSVFGSTTVFPGPQVALGSRPAHRPGTPAAPQSPQTAPGSETQAPPSGSAADGSPAAASSDESTSAPPGRSADNHPGKQVPASPNAAQNNGKAKGKAKSSSVATPKAPPSDPAAEPSQGRGNGNQAASPPSPDTTAGGNSGAAKGKADADGSANGNAYGADNGNGPSETPPGQSGDPHGTPQRTK